MTSFQEQAKAALTTQQPWRLQSISRHLKGFFPFFNTLRQTDNFLNPLRCQPCRLLQGWPPSAGGFDIPKGTTEDLYDVHQSVWDYITYRSKIWVFTTPFLKAWEVIAARSHFLGLMSLPWFRHSTAQQRSCRWFKKGSKGCSCRSLYGVNYFTVVSINFERRFFYFIKS